MKRIDHSCYLKLLASATVLERDGHGEKVLEQPDGTLVKIFRRKRWLSTALLSPYAQRFVRNTRGLADRGILSVRVVDIAYCRAVGRHLVTYQPLSGITLRQALRDSESQRCNLLTGFACYVADLHQKGIYFRSLHFGNIIVSHDGAKIGLIDVADLGLHSGPLSTRRRIRNFSHMLRYKEDREALRDYGWPDFLSNYLAAASLMPHAAQALRKSLNEIL